MITRQQSEAAVAGTSASSSMPDPCNDHGGSNPPTRKLRSLTSRTSRFTANIALAALVVAPSATIATPVAATDLRLKKSSRFRGVTKHRVTARFEAHLWDKSAYNIKQKKKGRQVYLGAYDDEISAAKAYDLAALKYWGPTTVINFKVENYIEQLKEMKETSRLEFLAELRRKSSGFSRGLSKFRGVARHHQNGRWEARIGRVEGNKYLYLGTFGTQEEAAEAYDKAAIKYRGPTAITNFELSRYQEEVEATQGPKKDASKKNLKESQTSKTIEGHLPNDLQTIENMTQSFDGGQNPLTTNTMNPCLDANLSVVTLDNPHTSNLLKDCRQDAQEKIIMQSQDSVFADVGETSGLNNMALKNSKQEEFFDHIASSNDLNIDLGHEYEDIMVGFNFQNSILTDFEENV